VDVAENTYVSQWHLSKLIHKNLGRSFSDIINNLRVERAKSLLAQPSLRIHEVGDMVGFNDVAHFSKIFKKHTGISPNTFRSQLR